MGYLIDVASNEQSGYKDGLSELESREGRYGVHEVTFKDVGRLG
jgi:hypothetical protein